MFCNIILRMVTMVTNLLWLSHSEDDDVYDGYGYSDKWLEIYMCQDFECCLIHELEKTLDPLSCNLFIFEKDYISAMKIKAWNDQELEDCENQELEDRKD